MGNVLHFFLFTFQYFVFFYFIFVNSFYTLSLLMSFRFLFIRSRSIVDEEYEVMLQSEMYRPISIIVPCYNEEKVIVSNLKSLLTLHYPEFEIIVVNDGSTDNTMQVLIDNFSLKKVSRPYQEFIHTKNVKGVYISLDYPNLVVVDKENGGKFDAVNAGINISKYPIFCSIDSDSLLEEKSLLRISEVFLEDKEVVAAGGIVRVLNGCKVREGRVIEVHAPTKAVEVFQTIEYTRAFLMGRTTLGNLKALLLISGAFGIFRKDLAIRINGYRKTVGEDMDFTVRLHRYCIENKIPFKIIFIPDPVCWTQVPDSWRFLIRQRDRWRRGLIDVLLYNFRMSFNPRYKTAGMVGFPYFILVEFLGPIIEFIGYVLIPVLLIFKLLNTQFAIIFFFVAILWGIFITIGSILMDNLLFVRYESLKDVFKLILFAFFEFVFYKELLAFVAFFATFRFRARKWGHIPRKKMEKTV